MKRAKYILIDDGMMESPIVFPTWLNHADIARALVGADGIDAGQVLSAGFVEFYGTQNGEVDCEVMGESTGLKLKPGKDDARFIARAMGMK